MSHTPTPLRTIRWQTGHDATGYYVEARLSWRGEVCDYRTYLGPCAADASPVMVDGAIRKATTTLGQLIAQAFPDDMTGWPEARP